MATLGCAPMRSRVLPTDVLVQLHAFFRVVSHHNPVQGLVTGRSR